MPNALKKFSPSESLHALEDVDLEELRAAGKRLILLDVDNTLLPWRSHDIPQSTTSWIEKGRSLGFDFCILSNTRNPERLAKLTSAMGLDFVRDRFKPHPKMYQIALDRYQCPPREAVMIGDQLLTDVLGANRCDIDAIWVKPIAKREFVGTTYFSRNVEKIVGRFLYQYFQEDQNAPGHHEERPGFFRKESVRQFAKFCLVGASSTAIDMGLNYLLMFVIPIHGVPLGTAFGQWLSQNYPAIFGHPLRASDAAFPILQIPSTCVAILNGFYWNRQWTFQIKDSAEKASQLRRYFLVVLLGLALGTGLSTGLNHIIPGHAKISWGIAKAVATIVVAFWNFAGSRAYVFRTKTS